MKVVLDTNVIFNDWELRKPSYQLLLKYAHLSNAVTIIIPEIVILEAVANYKEQIQEHYHRAKRARARLHGFGVNETLLPTMKPPEEASEMASKEYEFRLRSRVDETAYSPTHNQIAHQDILHRCFSKKKPFRNNGKGYRDALIWEVLIREVASNEDVTYLVTRNHHDFAEEDGKRLHTDLLADLESRSINVDYVGVYETLESLVEEQVKPNLHSTQALPEIKNGFRGSFSFQMWFEDHKDDIMEQIDAEHVINQIYNTYLDEPTISYIEDPISYEVSDVYELDEERAFIDIDTVVEIQFQFFIAKNEFHLCDDLPIEIEDPNWNKWVMLAADLVELRLQLELIYNARENHIEEFDVTLPEIFGFCPHCYRPEYNDASDSCSTCGFPYF
jgi:hypothetical protein